MNNTFKLGKSLVQIIPFHRVPIQRQEPKKERELITTKLIIVMAIIAIVKIAVLLLLI